MWRVMAILFLINNDMQFFDFVNYVKLVFLRIPKRLRNWLGYILESISGCAFIILLWVDETHYFSKLLDLLFFSQLLNL